MARYSLMGMPDLIDRFKSLAKKLEAYLESLMKERPRSIMDPMPERTGVYVFEEDGRFLYVGSAVNLHRHLKHNLMGSMGQPAQPHTFGKKLMKLCGDREKARNYLRKCRLRICQTKNEREAKVLEQVLIYLLNPLFND
jgi:excinuclease UvrABC nuclease subunit